MLEAPVAEVQSGGNVLCYHSQGAQIIVNAKGL
jgi:hypothetical protein